MDALEMISNLERKARLLRSMGLIEEAEKIEHEIKDCLELLDNQH